MLLVARTEAQIDQVHAILNRPIDGAKQWLDSRRERVVKNLHREDRRIGSLFANHRSYRGAVTQPVDEIVLLAAIRCDCDTACHTIYMRMIGMDAAVDDSDSNPPVHEATAVLKSFAKLP